MQTRPQLQIAANALRSQRLRALLSQEELAHKAELSLATIKALESQDGSGVHPKTVRKLCGVLGCQPSEIADVSEVA